MPDVWGEAEIDVHIDGSSLPGEVRRAAIVAAQQGGTSFRKQFRQEMRAAARGAATDFGRSLGNLVATIVRTSGAMRGLRAGAQGLGRTLRTVGGYAQDLGKHVTGRLRSGLQAVGKEFRALGGTARLVGQYIGGQASQAFDRLYVAARPIRRAIQTVGDGFRAVGNEVRGFGALVREDGARTMATLREGASHLKISMNDLRETFPGLAKAVDNSRSAFARARTAMRGVGENLKRLGPDMDAVHPAVERVREAWTKLGNTFRNARALSGDVRGGLKELSDAQRESADTAKEVVKEQDEVSRSVRDVDRHSRKGVGGIRGLLSNWKQLPHGFRQAVFWINLVIAALGALSVMGSGLGGTIVTLITMLSALGAAAGIAVVGFRGLFEEGAQLSEGAAASKQAFQDLGAAFQNLQAGITNNMFGSMATSIQGLTNNLLPALEGSLNTFAANVGANLARIFDALSSPAGIENFQALLNGFGPILDSLTTAAITFGDAIGDILVASLPTAQVFAQAIADVGKQFSDWTSSDAGRERIALFFQTAERIMPLIIDVVVQLGLALSKLVTPTTLAGTEQFLTALSGFIPILGQIIGVIANLNIFGLLAAALQAVGNIITPLVPILSQFAATLGQQLVEAMTMLTPLFTNLGVALAPVLEIISTLISAILPGLIAIIASVVQSVTTFLEAIVGAEAGSDEFKQAIEVLGNVVGFVFDAIGAIIGSTMEFSMGIFKVVMQLLRGDFTGAFETMHSVVASILDNFGVDIKDVERWFQDLLNAANSIFGAIGRAIGDFGNTVADVFGGVIGWISDAIGWFEDLFNKASAASGAANGARSGATTFARGGVLLGPRNIIAGEAGPEAIVPLRRALSQVDPSVRWLSAIAQGQSPAMAAGGVVGGGRSITIQEGAIQIRGAVDPRRTAVEVVDRIVERAVA